MKTRLSQAAAAARRAPNVRIFAWCAGVVVLWRACLELVNQTLAPLLLQTSGMVKTPVATGFLAGMQRWIRWDSGWYLVIIKHAYILQPHHHIPKTVAFFPLFPLIVRVLSGVLHAPIVQTGVALNLLLLCLAAFFLYKMTVLMVEKAGRKEGQAAAKLAVLLLLLNPAALFFASLYADAMLIFCATAAFYFALRKSFLWAALFAGLASGCKVTGIAIMPVLVLMYVQTNWEDIKKLKRLLTRHALRILTIVVLGSSGLLAYMLFLWRRFGSPIEFIKIEKNWQRSPGLSEAVKQIWERNYVHFFRMHELFTWARIYPLYLAILPVIIIIFVVYLLARHRLEFGWLALFCVLAGALPISSGQLVSFNRYVMMFTPAMAYVGAYLYTNRKVRPLVLGGLWMSATLLLIFSTLFLASYFIG